MTRNQLMYWQNKETERHNRAQEAAEIERNRINDAHYTRGDSESARHNLASEVENNRHNVAYETETNRHNVAYEAETNRHNTKTENIDRMYKASRGLSYLTTAANTLKSMRPSTINVDVTRTDTVQTFPSGGKQTTSTTTTRSTHPVPKRTTTRTPAAGTVTNGLSRFMENLGPAAALKFTAVPVSEGKRVKTGEMVAKVTNVFTGNKKSKRKKEHNNERQ